MSLPTEPNPLPIQPDAATQPTPTAGATPPAADSPQSGRTSLGQLKAMWHWCKRHPILVTVLVLVTSVVVTVYAKIREDAKRREQELATARRLLQPLTGGLRLRTTCSP
jgi:hypothetical protein